MEIPCPVSSSFFHEKTDQNTDAVLTGPCQLFVIQMELEQKTEIMPIDRTKMEIYTMLPLGTQSYLFNGVINFFTA